MNGESVFGWLKAAGALIALALLGYIAYQVLAWIKAKGGLAKALYQSPLGLPARGIDKGIQTVTGGADAGGEDTLGGVAARIREWWSGDAAKIEAMKRVDPPKTNGVSYSNSVYVGDLPMGDIALPNPRDAR